MASTPLQPSTTDRDPSWIARLARDFWKLPEPERERQLEKATSIEVAWLLAHDPNAKPFYRCGHERIHGLRRCPACGQLDPQ